jgi:hypothetical protein
VRPGAERRLDAAHVGAEVLRRGDNRGGHQPILDELLLVVDIVDEQVQRGGALDQARLDALPFLARDGARDDVQRPGAVDGAGRRAVLRVMVDRESDAHGLDGQLGGLLPHGDLVTVHLRQVTHERPPGSAGTPARAHEFIVEAGGRVGGPVGFHYLPLENTRAQTRSSKEVRRPVPRGRLRFAVVPARPFWRNLVRARAVRTLCRMPLCPFMLRSITSPTIATTGW